MSELSANWWEETTDEAVSPISVHHRVIALLVNRNGRPWLAETLMALRFQTRSVDELVKVDLSSEDGSEKLLAIDGEHQFLSLPAEVGFAAALNAAEESVEVDAQSVEWVWLLHDDSAPAADALAELLAAADRHPHASVIGAKVIDWRRPDHVLEVGTALTAIGTRFTGLEHGERDQGQHDETRPAMTVSSAGMLVRREVWRSLGGFTEDLAHFRLETEFALRAWENGYEVWVAPSAKVRHEAATARGLRPVEGHRGSAHFIDRYAGLLIAFSRTRRHWLWLRWIWVLLATTIRSVAYLVLQDLRGARAESAAALAAVVSRKRVLALRRAAGSAAAPKELRPSFREQLSHLSTEIVDTIQGSASLVVDWLLPERERIGDVGAGNALRAALKRPGAILSIILLTVGLAVGWPLLGQGALVLANGESVPDSSTSLIGEFLSSWHAVGFGSTQAANPFVLWIGLFSLPFSSPVTYVRVAVIFGVWTAGMSMHLALRRIISHAPTRVWLSALYALSPVVLLSAARGDVAMIWAATLLPWLFYMLDKVGDSWRWSSAAGLLLTVLAAIWPVIWLAAFLLYASSFAWRRPTLLTAARKLAVPMWPLWLLAPWSFEVTADPTRWFAQFGALHGGSTTAFAALFSWTSGGPAWFWSIGLLTAAVLAARDQRNRAIQTRLWVSVVTVLAVAFIGQICHQLWPDLGFSPDFDLVALAVTVALVAIIATSLAFVRIKLAREDFGWRQVTILGLAVLVSLQPLSSIWSATRLSGYDRAGLQPAITSEMLRGFTEPTRLRTLLLRSGESAEVDAQLLDGRVLSLGDLAVVDDSDSEQLAGAVVDWLTKAGSSEASPLQRFGIGYVAVPFGDSISRRVAALGGLRRVITARNSNLVSVWQVTDVTSRAFVGDGNSAADDLLVVSMDSAAPEVSGTFAARDKETTIALADRSDGLWIATLAGKPLPSVKATELRWKVKAGRGGNLLIKRAEGERGQFLLIAALGWLSILAVLAPRRRRIYEDEWLEE